MLVDLYRGLRIVLKFLFYDLWLWLYKVLFQKQNPKLKATYQKRVGTKKKRLNV